MAFLVLCVRFALCFMSATLIELLKLVSVQALYLCVALVGLARFRQLGDRRNVCSHFISSVSFLYGIQAENS